MSLEELGHTILEFVKLHQAWAAPIVFALAFAESLAFLSLVVPAWAVVLSLTAHDVGGCEGLRGDGGGP